MSSGGEFIKMCGFFAFSRCGMAYFDTMKVPRVLIWCIRSKRRMSVSTTGVRWTALALLTTTSSPPKVATACSIALFTCASSRTSTTMGSAFPPTLVISSAAVKMVPGNLGCGLSVLAAITTLAPSRAARNAIARPMPRDAPVMNRVRLLSVMIPQSFRSGSGKDAFSGERRVGVVDAVRRFDDGALEALGPHGEVLGKEARDRNTSGRVGAIAAEPHRRECLLGKERTAGREREQLQIGCRPRKRRRDVVALAAEEPMGGALQRVGRILKPHASPSEIGVIACIDGLGSPLEFADIRQYRRAARQRQLARNQVDCLDAVGAFVNRRDACVAVVLRGAGFFDVTHTAVHLHAERGDLVADVGRKCLGNGREQGGAFVRRLARRFVLAALRAIERDGGGIGQRTRRARERAHSQQHALDVGMRDDRARPGLHAGCPALL